MPGGQSRKSPGESDPQDLMAKVEGQRWSVRVDRERRRSPGQTAGPARVMGHKKYGRQACLDRHARRANFVDAQKRAAIALAVVRTVMVGMMIGVIGFRVEILVVVMSTSRVLAIRLIRMRVVAAAAEHQMHDEHRGNQVGDEKLHDLNPTSKPHPSIHSPQTGGGQRPRAPCLQNHSTWSYRKNRLQPPPNVRHFGVVQLPTFVSVARPGKRRVPWASGACPCS
jgi:hypothetical protein